MNWTSKFNFLFKAICIGLKTELRNISFKQVASELENCDIFGDKAYHNVEDRNLYKTLNNLEVVTPIKLKKGQKRLDSADKLYSTIWSVRFDSRLNLCSIGYRKKQEFK